jgi:plastocyanin
MYNVWAIPLMAALVLAPVYINGTSGQGIILPQQQNTAYAQVISQDSNNNVTESSFITAVIIIGKDMQGNVTYTPNNLTIKQGEEILVINNDTNIQSMTNGIGPNDPLAGKLFDTGPITPGGFTEYVASTLSPGNYTFYSTNSSSAKGFLTIEPAN